MSNWKNVTGLDLAILRENRKALHQAVQLVGAFPRNMLPHDPTDGTASLVWNSSIKSLESLPFVNDDGAFKVGLSFTVFELYIELEGDQKSACCLSGMSVNEGLVWLKQNLAELGIKADHISLDLPYEIENYDYSEALVVDKQALQEYADLYQNTQNSLRIVLTNWKEAFDIRCWPHHFDLATLIPLKTDSEGEILKSIGVGLSPGDEGVEEPYVYVNIWPEVDLNILEKHSLPIGQWNKAGWSGAVLTYAQMLDSKN
ncbi:MAG: hypothetical protein ACI9J3_003065, partial [Parvicellaceae bacterium]